jgi:hypothetical protein
LEEEEVEVGAGVLDGEGGASGARLAGRGEVMEPLLDRPPEEVELKVECEVTWRNFEGAVSVDDPLLGPDCESGDSDDEEDDAGSEEEEVEEEEEGAARSSGNTSSLSDEDVAGALEEGCAIGSDPLRGRVVRSLLAVAGVRDRLGEGVVMEGEGPVYAERGEGDDEGGTREVGDWVS